MDHVIRQLVAQRREEEARGDAARWLPYAEQPGPGARVLRRGVARIVSNDGGGDYEITERWWNPAASPPAWEDATGPVGYVEAPARDYANRDVGAAGDCVLFWEQRAKGGALELLIDAVGRRPCWGKAAAGWTSGNAVTLDPCQADGTDIPNANNVTAYVVSPTADSPDGDGLEPDISQGDVLAYLPYGSDEGVLVNVRWKASAAGIDVVVNRRFNIAANTTVTLDSGDWRGRTIWYSMACISAESGSAADQWPGQWGELSASVSDYYVGANPYGDAERTIDTVTTSNGDTGRLYIDDTAGGSGELKLEAGSYAARWHLIVTVVGFGRLSVGEEEPIP